MHDSDLWTNTATDKSHLQATVTFLRSTLQVTRSGTLRNENIIHSFGVQASRPLTRKQTKYNKVVRTRTAYASYPVSPLGGAIVSVLANGPKVRGLNPAETMDFLRDIKIRSTPSLGSEVKPSVSCRKILQNVKNHFDVLTKLFWKLNSSFPMPSFSWFATRWVLVGFPESSGGRIRSFSLSTSSFHYGSPRSYITWGMNNKPVSGHSWET
jgi:hypothetical protein